MFRLYGIHKNKFSGAYEDWKQMVHPDDRERLAIEEERAIHGETPSDIEFRIICPDGEIRYVKENAIVIRDKRHSPIRMTGINYDITTRIEHEQEIVRYARQLETQTLSLEELADELTTINQELDAQVRQRTEEISHMLVVKSDLITQIGHDLNTPLTPLIALLPLIDKKSVRSRTPRTA
ncbi:MAG: PAS domain-containing protein [Methanospirillaceae archaeon]|nr:PAS domain-containing protein [Methanospirillaceae archaeon]